MRKHPRHFGNLSLACIVAWLALSVCAVAVAQETPDQPSTPSQDTEPSTPPADNPPADKNGAPAANVPAVPEPLPGEIFPRIYYLPDREGKLQAMPGFELEEFLELYKLKHQLAEQDRPPKFSISSLSLSGETQGRIADLTADFTITVHTSGWIRAPLRLDGAVLREPPTFEGPGQHVDDVAEDGSGYVVWIRSEPDTTHRVKLRLWVPLAQVGAESHLRLNLPRSRVAQLQLRVPLANAVARISEGSTLESAQPTTDGRTLLKVVGLAGEFDLAWNAVDGPIAQLPTVLEATGAITVRIDGRNIRSDAKLTVRSSGGEFDRFAVRLPAGTKYVPSAQGGATVVVTEADDDQRGQLCEVRLARKTSGPVEIRLMGQRANQPQPDNETLELAGFEVIDAVRQWGTVTVQVAGNWQVQWGAMRHIRQTDELSGLMGGDESTTAFEYSVQPFSLTARIKLQQTRVRVEADYVIHVGSEQAELQARLKYTVRGAKVRSFEVDAPGWDIDQIGPGNLVNIDAVAAGQNNPFVIPLRQLTSGDVEVTLQARQKISPESGAISLRVPVPRGESVAAANLTIVPADNVELLMKPDESVDLATQSVRPRNLELPERQQEPFYLRTTGESPVFVASIKVHKQEISTAVATQVRIDDRNAVVDARITYQISYEPTDHVLLGLPRSLAADQITVTLDGQRLVPTPARRRGDEPTDRRSADVVPMRVEFPTPRIGACELRIKYSVPHELLASQTTRRVDVPLVIPNEGTLTANTLTVTPLAGISMTYPKGRWTEDARGTRPAAPGALALAATSAIPEVALALSVEERRKEHSTRIDQVWMQSRLTDSRRQDRAVFRLTTSQSSLRMTLPDGADLASLELHVDGSRVRYAPDPQGETGDIIVPLGSAANDKHLLDLRYRFNRRPPRGNLALAAPRIESAGWVRQLYWQVVLPDTEHVFGTPRNFVREYRWARSNLFWHRRPSLDEHELEHWIGAAPSTGSALSNIASQDPPGDGRQRPATSTNRYLYSTFGASEPLEVHTVGRTWLVLIASLPLLVCGLLLIYLPAARHPAVLLVAAMVVAAVTLVDPESVWLLAQAASLGLVLTVLAFVLARVAARPVITPVPARGSSHAIERPYSELYPRPLSVGSQPSTTTNPLLSSSAPEHQP